MEPLPLYEAYGYAEPMGADVWVIGAAVLALIFGAWGLYLWKRGDLVREAEKDRAARKRGGL